MAKKCVYVYVYAMLSLTDQSSAYFLHIYINFSLGHFGREKKMMEKGQVIQTMWNKMRTIDFSMDEQDEWDVEV